MVESIDLFREDFVLFFCKRYVYLLIRVYVGVLGDELKSGAQRKMFCQDESLNKKMRKKIWKKINVDFNWDERFCLFFIFLFSGYSSLQT